MEDLLTKSGRKRCVKMVVPNLSVLPLYDYMDSVCVIVIAALCLPPVCNVTVGRYHPFVPLSIPSPLRFLRSRLLELFLLGRCVDSWDGRAGEEGDEE